MDVIVADLLPKRWSEAPKYIEAINAEIRKYAEREGIELLTIGKSDKGYEVLGLKVGQGNPIILSVTRIHGDELAGTNAVLDLVDRFSRKNPGFCYVCIPLANPDAASKFLRFITKDGRLYNLNREFSSMKFKINHVLNNFIAQLKPNILIDHHEHGYFGFKVYIPPGCQQCKQIAEEIIKATPNYNSEVQANVSIQKLMGQFTVYMHKMYKIPTVLVETTFFLDLSKRVSQHCLAVEIVGKFFKNK